MIMMIIGLHRIMIAKFIRYYNGLVLLFVRMGRPWSPGVEARGRCLSSLSKRALRSLAIILPSSVNDDDQRPRPWDRPPTAAAAAAATSSSYFTCFPSSTRSTTATPASLSSYRSSARLRHHRPWTTTRGAVVVVADEAAAAAAPPPCFIVPLPPAPSPMSPSFHLLKSTCGGRGRGGVKEGG
jgi:hypothetical protein